jgi:hypothetical protein
MSETIGLPSGPNTIYQHLQKNGPSTKQQLIELSSLSERSVRSHLDYLKDHSMVKLMPSFGRVLIYAPIDYVPVFDETKPLAQRWQLFSPADNTRYTVGELATYYGHEVPAKSLRAAEFLLKAPALLSYLAQENELSEEELTQQLLALRDVLSDACDQLESARSVLTQLISDPRYWRPDLLQMFKISPDFPLPKDLTLIINRLRDEQENQDVAQ